MKDISSAMEQKYSSQIEDLNKKMKAMSIELESERKQREENKKLSEEKYKKEIRDLQEKINTTIAQKEHETETIIQQINKAHSDEIQRQTKHTQNLNQDIINHKTKLNMLEAQLESSRDTIRNEVQKEFQQRIATLESTILEHSSTIAKTTSEIKAAEAKVSKVHLDAEARRVAEIAAKDKELNEVRAQLSKELNEVRAQLTKVTAETDKAKLLAEKAIADKLNAEIKERLIDITKLRESAAKREAEIRAEMAALNEATIAQHNNVITQILTSFTEKIEKIHTSSGDDLKQRINDIQKEIDNKLLPITKFYGGTNMEKGGGGEFAIRKVLLEEKIYDDATVEDVSQTDAAGDVVFKWRDIKCLIEVKNKAAIGKDDITKFERDIAQQKQKINCAIFISLRSKHMPGKTRKLLNLEYVMGTPVIYCYAPPPCAELHIAIEFIQMIVSTQDKGAAQTIEVTNKCREYYQLLIELIDSMTKDINRKRRELKQMENKIAELTKSKDTLETMIGADYIDAREETQPEKVIVKQKEDKEEGEEEETSTLLSTDKNERLDQLADFYISKVANGVKCTGPMIAEHFKIKPRLITTIGLKNIKERAVTNFSNKVINTDVLQKISNWARNNGNVFPTRAIMVKQRIMTDSAFKKLARLSDEESTTELIYKKYMEWVGTPSKPTTKQSEVEEPDGAQEEETKETSEEAESE
jgi:hypothetical protein